VTDILFFIYHNSRNYPNRNYCFGFCFSIENGMPNLVYGAIRKSFQIFYIWHTIMWLGRILGTVSSFVIRHFLYLCAIRAWRTRPSRSLENKLFYLPVSLKLIFSLCNILSFEKRYLGNNLSDWREIFRGCWSEWVLCFKRRIFPYDECAWSYGWKYMLVS